MNSSLHTDASNESKQSENQNPSRQEVAILANAEASVPSHPGIRSPVRVFALAADADRKHLYNLRKQLHLAIRYGVIDFMISADVPIGENVEHWYQRCIDGSSIVVLLVSADLFLDHEYIVRFAEERSAYKQKTIVPVLLNEFPLIGSALRNLQALPKEIGPLYRWKDKDAAWAHVAKQLCDSIQHKSF